MKQIWRIFFLSCRKLPWKKSLTSALFLERTRPHNLPQSPIPDIARFSYFLKLKAFRQDFFLIDCLWTVHLKQTSLHTCPWRKATNSLLHLICDLKNLIVPWNRFENILDECQSEIKKRRLFVHEASMIIMFEVMSICSQQVRHAHNWL